MKNNDLTSKKLPINNEREKVFHITYKTNYNPVMKKITLAFFLLLGFSLNSFANCYLVIDGKHSLSQTALEQIAQIELSRYVEPLSETPPVGISEKDCVYRLTVTGLDQGIILVVKGPRLTSYAESNLEGIQAFQQALFRIIIQEDPLKKPAICQKNINLLTKECTASVTTKPVVDKNTVYDPVTELTWQKDETAKMNWKAANEYCQNLELAGSGDWRLPNRTEIGSTFPIQKLFPDRKDYYWSSTPHSEDKYYSWGYSVSEGELFSDWNENRYHVRCAKGSELEIAMPDSQVVHESAEPVESETQESSEDTLGIHWVAAPTYVSGFYQVATIYDHNIKEQGHSLDEGSNGTPIGIVFSPYYQMASGLRFGGKLGPMMFYTAIIGDDEYRFAAFPVEANVGYTMSLGSTDTKAVFFKGGISKLNASGDFVESEALGISGAAGMEFLRNRRVSIGFEAGVDTASVKLKKYDCSASSTRSDFSTCQYETKNVWPVGFTASFLVIF